MKQQIALVQAYIKHRIDKDVQISISNPRDMILLSQAYNYAVNWFQSNNGKVEMI